MHLWPARSRRLHPVVPDRSAPGAAIDQQPKSQDCEDDRPAPQHDLLHPRPHFTTAWWAVSSDASASSLPG